MAKQKYNAKSAPKQHRRFTRHIDFRLLENTPREIVDYCPDGCYTTGKQELVKRRATTTRHGSHYGVLIVAIYRCNHCGHVYTSSAWRKNLQQMSLFDLVKEGEKP